MTLKEFIHNKWTRFGFWALLYILWVIWLENYWFLLGLGVIFDIFITKKVHWNFWKKRYKEGEKHSAWNDWLDAIVFAVIVVTIINTFWFQAFKIPSSSMEKTLYTGDHLFVSKLTYGPKLPQTPLTVPFTHNVMFGKESYSTLIQNKYRRLKGIRSVERGDIVVFGFPNGDTIFRKDPSVDYYQVKRSCDKRTFDAIVKTYGPLVSRPADKVDHYVDYADGSEVGTSEKTSFVLPSLSEQKKIVAKLDAFSAVVTALDEEIAARREQFAGWLEKLMEFREAA